RREIAILRKVSYSAAPLIRRAKVVVAFRTAARFCPLIGYDQWKHGVARQSLYFIRSIDLVD
ncbi:hypothetical protein ACLMJV_17855, partial [Sinorhizobium meliloti]|uniref:hypothetical protein n=1 Tax=Rhizobium meliloti TaxID=382 RepID=UPI00398C9A15